MSVSRLDFEYEDVEWLCEKQRRSMGFAGVCVRRIGLCDRGQRGLCDERVLDLRLPPSLYIVKSVHDAR